MSAKIFLSTVSDEFRAYRDQLRSGLTRHNVEVKVQEDFKDLGRGMLDELDVYIAHCDAVVHLVGDMTGSDPGEHALGALRREISRSCGQTAAARRGAEKWLRRFLHAVGGLARALPRQTAVHRESGRQRRTRPEIRCRRPPRAPRRPSIWRVSRRWTAIPAAPSPAQTISPSTYCLPPILDLLVLRLCRGIERTRATSPKASSGKWPSASLATKRSISTA